MLESFLLQNERISRRKSLSLAVYELLALLFELLSTEVAEEPTPGMVSGEPSARQKSTERDSKGQQKRTDKLGYVGRWEQRTRDEKSEPA